MPDPKDLTEQQKIALKRLGKEDAAPPAPKEEELAAAKKKEEDEKIAADLKLKEEQEKANAGKNKTTSAVELTDEQLFEIASKKAGRKITSWADLQLSPTAEEEKKKQDQKEAEKLAWGLKAGKFNKKQFENYTTASKDPKGLVYNDYAASAKEANPDISDAEIKEQFEARFGLDKDETSWQYKQGIKEINRLADNMIKEEFGSILSLDNEYASYEQQENDKRQQEQKVLAEAPNYKKVVSDVMEGLTSIEVPVSEKDKYSISIPKEVKDGVEKLLLNEEYVSAKILKGYTPEEIKEEVLQSIIYSNFGILAAEANKLHMAKHEKGLRGIPEGGKLQQPADGYEHLTEQQQKAIQFFNIDKKPVGAN